MNNFMEKGCESMKSDLMKLAQILAETLMDEYLYKDDDTTANKFWLGFATRKFMNQSLRN